jgi:hypothetical protein
MALRINQLLRFAVGSAQLLSLPKPFDLTPHSRSYGRGWFSLKNWLEQEASSSTSLDRFLPQSVCW